MNGRHIHEKHCPIGQSIVEAVVAVGIAIVLITGLVSAATSTLRISQMSKDRTQALQYAKEGLEIVRIVKDSNWNDLPQTTVTYCLSKGQQSLGEGASDDCPFDIDNVFSRTILISDEGISCTAAAFCRKVTVTVSFKEQDQTRSVILTSYVTNWRMR